MTASTDSAPQYVFRLLRRHRSLSQNVTGAVFASTLPALRTANLNVFAQVDLPDGTLAHVLFQGGRLVFAAHGARASEAAAAHVAALLTRSHVTFLALPDELATLAFAAVDGAPSALAVPLDTEAQQLTQALQERGFSGALALEFGLSCEVWQWRAGVITAGPPPPSHGPGKRLTCIAWEERALPELPFTPAAESTPAPRPAPRLGRPTRDALSEDAWAKLERELRLELDDRADRLLALLRAAHANTARGSLSQSLAREIERVAGPERATAYLRRLRADTSPETLEDA